MRIRSPGGRVRRPIAHRRAAQAQAPRANRLRARLGSSARTSARQSTGPRGRVPCAAKPSHHRPDASAGLDRAGDRWTVRRRRSPARSVRAQPPQVECWLRARQPEQAAMRLTINPYHLRTARAGWLSLVLPTRAVVVVAVLLMAALRLAIAPALSLTLPWAVLWPGRSGVYLGVAPLGTRWCNRYRRHLLLLRVLRGGSVARLVAVVAVMQRLLLLDLGIPASRVLPLIDRQRGRGR